MATKAELLDQAREQGLDVNSKTTKSELESMLASNDTSNTNTNGGDVVVNENDNGEATNGTTKQGDESPVKNGENVPQNGVTEIETTPETSVTSTNGDENRSEEEIKFADEANPNNKARYTGAGGGEYDQDGNLRTGGKSYGVADDRNEEVSQDVFLSNRGEAPEGSDRVLESTYFNPTPGEDNDTNNQEWDKEDQEKLEESLSQPDEGIVARVTTSTGSYVRVKFFRNNLPFGTFKSRDFTEAKAAKYRDDLKESRGL